MVTVAYTVQFYMQPYCFRYIPNLWQKIIFPQLVDSRVYHNSSNPSHQDHFYIFVAFHFKPRKAAENFYKTIIYNVYGFIIAVYVAEHDL